MFTSNTDCMNEISATVSKGRIKLSRIAIEWCNEIFALDDKNDAISKTAPQSYILMIIMKKNNVV